MNNLTHYDIKYLTGVGPKRAEILAKELDIKSFHDMLYNFPFRYIDRSTIHHICDLRGADIPSVQLKGRFVTFNTQGEGARRSTNEEPSALRYVLDHESGHPSGARFLFHPVRRFPGTAI